MTAKTYSSDDIDIHFDLKRCIHAAKCVHGMPDVFDPKAKPWVRPDRGGADALAAVVHQCPTGALTYTRKDGGAAEEPQATSTVTIDADGPLEVRGRIEIGGEVVTRAALCRCGASQNKPFCDNAHKSSGWSDDGLPDPGEVADGGAEGAVACAAYPNGPLHLTGGVEIVASDGEVVFRGEEAYLCRCGASNNKPFCDGMHKQVGFEG